MTETNSKIGFRQFQPALKFVVVWIGICCLINIMKFIGETRIFFSEILLDTDHNWDIGGFINAIIQFSLVKGLINKQNSARIWASIFSGIGILFLSIYLGWMIFKVSQAISYSFGYEIFNYDIPLTLFQYVGYLASWIVYNGIVLYILLRPSTKALFSSPPASLSEPSNSNHPETADPSSIIH